MLTMRQRKALSYEVRKRYQRSRKEQKGEILDEFIKTTGYNRSYARWVLGSLKKQGRKKKYPARKRTYDASVFYPLRTLWITADYICGTRLRPFLPELIRVMEKNKELKLKEEIKKKTSSPNLAHLAPDSRQSSRWSREPAQTFLGPSCVGQVSIVP